MLFRSCQTRLDSCTNREIDGPIRDSKNGWIFGGTKQERKARAEQSIADGALRSSSPILEEKKHEEKARHARKKQMVLSSKKLSCDLEFGRHDQTTLLVESKDQMFLALCGTEEKANSCCTDDPLAWQELTGFLLLRSHFLFFSGAEEGEETAIASHA